MNRVCVISPITACLLFLVAGCGGSSSESLTTYGEEHRVELYSGGQKVREWFTTGKVPSDENGNGFYFQDADSGQLVRVSGNVTITPLMKGEARSSGGTQQETDPAWDGIPPNIDAGQAINGKADLFDDDGKLKAL